MPNPDHPDHIDQLVPAKVMRLTQHLHNIIYIRFFYENIGQQPPDWIKREQQRADLALQEELEREHHQGGAFHETRKSQQQWARRPQGRTEAASDEPGVGGTAGDESGGQNRRRSAHQS
jgi:hypothetical protein